MVHTHNFHSTYSVDIEINDNELQYTPAYQCMSCPVCGLSMHVLFPILLFITFIFINICSIHGGTELEYIANLWFILMILSSPCYFLLFF